MQPPTRNTTPINTTSNGAVVTSAGPSRAARKNNPPTRMIPDPMTISAMPMAGLPFVVWSGAYAHELRRAGLRPAAPLRLAVQEGGHAGVQLPDARRPAARV